MAFSFILPTKYPCHWEIYTHTYFLVLILNPVWTNAVFQQTSVNTPDAKHNICYSWIFNITILSHSVLKNWLETGEL